MNGTDLKSFSHFQIFTKIPYPELSRSCEAVKAVKVHQNDQTQI